MSLRTGSFVLGACVGAVCARQWRPITKRTIKAGLAGRTAVKTGAARAAENLSDVTNEARWEMELDGKGRPAGDRTPPVGDPIAGDGLTGDGLTGDGLAGGGLAGSGSGRGGLVGEQVDGAA